MSRPPDDAVDGVPASIAAIMAAIRHEVAARPAAAAAAEADPPVAIPVAAADAVPVDDDPVPAADDAQAGAGDDAGMDPHPAAPALPPQLDGDVRTLLAPLLKTWLDAHLPEIVETAVHAEIRRLTGMA